MHTITVTLIIQTPHTLAAGTLNVEAEYAEGRHLAPLSLWGMCDQLLVRDVHLQLTARHGGQGQVGVGVTAPQSPMGRRQLHPATTRDVVVYHEPSNIADRLLFI